MKFTAAAIEVLDEAGWTTDEAEDEGIVGTGAGGSVKKSDAVAFLDDVADEEEPVSIPDYDDGDEKTEESGDEAEDEDLTETNRADTETTQADIDILDDVVRWLGLRGGDRCWKDDPDEEDDCIPDAFADKVVDALAEKGWKPPQGTIVIYSDSGDAPALAHRLQSCPVEYGAFCVVTEHYLVLAPRHKDAEGREHARRRIR